MDKKYLFIEYTDIYNIPYAAIIIEFEGYIRNKVRKCVILKKPKIVRIKNYENKSPEPIWRQSLSTLDEETLIVISFGKTFKYNISETEVTEKWFKNYTFNTREEAELLLEIKE